MGKTKKNSKGRQNFWYLVLGLVLVAIGIIGDRLIAGYYFWLAAIGAITLLIKNDGNTKWVSVILKIVSIVILFYFAITLWASF